MKTFFVVIAALLSCALATPDSDPRLPKITFAPITFTSTSLPGCGPKPTKDTCEVLGNALITLETTLPACAGSEYPECTLDNLVNEGNYVNQLSCPVSDRDFLICLLQGEGLLDENEEPVMDMVAAYAAALGLPNPEGADLDTIVTYGPAIFSGTVCMSDQCQLLNAAQEGVCDDLEMALVQLETDLPDCAKEVGRGGSGCSLDNAGDCPIWNPSFVLCLAVKQGLVTPNMDAIQPIMTALNVQGPPESFLKRGGRIVNAVTDLAQECRST